MKILLFVVFVAFQFLERVQNSNQQELTSYHRSTPNDPEYVAGVVEFQPNLVGNVKEQWEGYANIIESKEAEPTDIIVFPESTFNNLNSLAYVPDPKNKIVLCEELNTTLPLHRISCLAKKVQKYILINVSERENCTAKSQDSRPCSEDGLNKYNTNVVFDRNGTVISRYRKWHLYGENEKNTTVRPEYATFETDFGVTFGHFICFDILFYTPTQELIEKGVKDFLFPTMWFSELPFLTAVQQQRGWAYGNDVNLLAAGASFPKIGSTGTGIYAGRKGSLISVMNSEPERKIYVAKVPKKNSNTSSTFVTPDLPRPQNSKRLKGLKLLRDNVNGYTMKPLNLTSLQANETICSKSICCTFYVKWAINNSSSSLSISSGNSYEYVLAAYEGERTYQHRDVSYIRTCALIACTNQNTSSCGTVFPDDVEVINQFIFNEIEIEGKFRENGKSLIVPSNLDETILPLPVEQFSFEITKITNETNQIVKCQLKTTKANLLTFGIYANDFEDPSKNSGSELTLKLTTTISLLLVLIVNFTQM